MTVIISLYYKETNQNVVFTLPLQKSSSRTRLGKFKGNQKYCAK